MFKLITGILVGLALLAGAWWYYSRGGKQDPIDGFQEAVKYQGGKAMNAVEKGVSDGVKGARDGLTNAVERISEEASDTTLLATIKAKLVRERSLDGFEIDVDVEHGAVSLKGTVSSTEARALAIKLTRETKGVKSVRADLPLAQPANK